MSSELNSYFTFDPFATEEPVSRSVLVVAYPIDIPLNMTMAIRGFSDNFSYFLCYYEQTMYMNWMLLFAIMYKNIH